MSTDTRKFAPVPEEALREAAPVNRSIAPRYFDRVVNRLIIKEDFEPITAIKAVDGAWSFMRLAVDEANRDMPLAPTRIIDEAWHASILFTRDYARLCDTLGRFVHHEPADHLGGQAEGLDHLRATVAKFEELTIPYDAELWDFALGADSGSNCCATDGSCSCWG